MSAPLTPTAQVPGLCQLEQALWTLSGPTSLNSLVGILNLEDVSIGTEDCFSR